MAFARTLMVDRHPCAFCGTRGDIGCGHRHRVANRPFDAMAPRSRMILQRPHALSEASALAKRHRQMAAR